jgi:hypothetical protein
MRRSMEAIQSHAEARIQVGEAMLSGTACNLEPYIAAVVELKEAKNRAMGEYELHVLQHRAPEVVEGALK